MLAGLHLLTFQLQLASNMSRLMDLSKNPCVDFYEYACGNYKNFARIPDDRPGIDGMTEMDMTVKKELKDIFEEPDQPNDPQSTRMVRQFYRSCMNEQQLERLGAQPLKNLLESYGGWPVVKGDSWRATDYDWMKVNARITTNLLGSDILAFQIQPNLKNSTRKTLGIDQGTLGLMGRHFYLDPRARGALDAYSNFMYNTAIQLGANAATASKELQDVMNLELDLAQIMVPDELKRDLSTQYHPMRVADLIARYPKINFDIWFKTAAQREWKFSDNDEINLSGLPYLDQLSFVLGKYDARTLANFQIWKLCMSHIGFLPPSQRSNERKFMEAMSGVRVAKPRWVECVDISSFLLKQPVGSMFVKRYFDQGSKQELETMVTNVRRAFATTIDSANWMDSTTRSNAQNKLSKMLQNIAFPPEIFDETWIMREHSNAKVSESNYLDNKLSLTLSESDFLMRYPISRNDWGISPATVNALYIPLANKMIFPASMLRPPFYYPDAPDYYNFGRIGHVMGHELTHGFDDQGRKFNSDGNLEQWWSQETLAKFNQSANCFIYEYSSIVEMAAMPPMSLNGPNTVGENIADNGGLRLAYKAFKSVRKNPAVSSKEQNKVHHIFENFTPDQLFFLSYGQNWCSLIRPETLQMKIDMDPHAPAKYRVNVPLQNFDQFASAFKCPLGTPMNPVQKCQIW